MKVLGGTKHSYHRVVEHPPGPTATAAGLGREADSREERVGKAGEWIEAGEGVEHSVVGRKSHSRCLRLMFLCLEYVLTCSSERRCRNFRMCGEESRQQILSWHTEGDCPWLARRFTHRGYEIYN